MVRSGMKVMGPFQLLTIGIGDMQLASVLSSIAITVTDKRRLPMVVKERIRHGEIISGVREVGKTIAVVLVMVTVGR